jgi:hypothetical protein
MTASSYASDTKLVKNRTAGYTQNDKQIENATAISMSQPYAAGSILSTVEDLAKWNQSLQEGKLIKKETLAKAFTRYKLVNGKEINYGYGVRNGFIQGSPSIWHGGLINGFRSMVMYLPKEGVYVAILSNCDCVSPERATAKLAALAIGKPYEYIEIPVDSSLLKAYTGVYENENGDQVLISVAEKRLQLQRGNNRKVGLKAFNKDQFFFDDPLMSAEFKMNNEGTTEKLIIKTRNGNEIWNRTDKTQLNNAEIKVDDKLLDMYTGEYEVSGQFRFIITKEKDRMFIQADGQEKLEMFAEAQNKFFLKVNDAKFEFVNEGGKVARVFMSQGGRSTDAKKVK